MGMRRNSLAATRVKTPSLPPGFLVGRVAKADGPALDRLMKQAGAFVHSDVSTALFGSSFVKPSSLIHANPNITAAQLEAGVHALIRRADSDGARQSTYVALVCREPGGGVVGAILVGPPSIVISGLLTQPSLSDAEKRQVLQQLLLGAGKIYGVAVDSGYQGKGIGGALLLEAQGIYASLNYRLFYGQFRTIPSGGKLNSFYSRYGFRVLPRTGEIPLRAFWEGSLTKSVTLQRASISSNSTLSSEQLFFKSELGETRHQKPWAILRSFLKLPRGLLVR